MPHSSSETDRLNYRVLALRMSKNWSCHQSRGLPADEMNLGCLHIHRPAISKGLPVLKTRVMSFITRSSDQPPYAEFRQLLGGTPIRLEEQQSDV